MKLLVIICSHEFNPNCSNNIRILNDYMKLLDMDVEYCGISNQDDFHNYESLISFKYKIINTKRQFSKICDFITDYQMNVDYDWYMKIRPDIKLLENINFDIMSKNAVNARARVYNGPSKIKYGMSVNGQGGWKNVGDCHYSEKEHNIILDDQLFIFHRNVVHLKAFNKIQEETPGYDEWKQAAIFNSRNIPMNVVGIYLEITKYNAFSGNINIKDDFEIPKSS
jgi:hypothetical protein